MKKFTIAILMWILFIRPAFAEIIDGPANVRADKNAIILFSLNDGTEVEVIGKIGDWYKIAKYVSIRKEDFDDPDKQTIKKDSLIFELDYVEIGNVVNQTAFIPFGEERVGYFQGYITGLTHKQNIKRDSIAEIELQKILKSSSGPYQFEYFEGMLERLGYIDWISDDEFKSYLIYEPSFLDPSAGARNILVFNNDVLLAIILQEGRELGFGLSKSFATGYKVLLFKKENIQLVNRFVEKYSKIIENSD